ncbi:MAG: methyltransferase domain-containing protein [Thermoplasmatota archaeon]
MSPLDPAALAADLECWRAAGGMRHERARMRGHDALIAAALRRAPPPGVFVDAGAGDARLARRAAGHGYRAVACELTSIFPPSPWTARASFDRLPLRDETAHIVAFSASLHYTSDLDTTLREARRVLGPKGILCVALSPFHGSAADADRAAATTRRHIRDAGGEGPLATRYSHLVEVPFLAALRNAGFPRTETLANGLSRETRWRSVKAFVTHRPYAGFPLIVASS